MVCVSLLMTQQIPQTKAGDVLVLEICISAAPVQRRWDLWSMLSPPAVYTSPLFQPSTISQLLFSLENEREVVHSSLEPEGKLCKRVMHGIVLRLERTFL